MTDTNLISDLNLPLPEYPKDRPLRMLSWGIGRQSTGLLVMSLHGILPPLDGAIFCDPGYERKASYDILHFYTAYAANFGLPVYRLYPGNIRDDILNGSKENRFASIPFHGTNQKGDPTILRRQCTGDYKIKPARKFLRSEFKVTAKKPVEMWIGFGTDEALRVKPDDVKYIKKVYPLIDQGMNTSDVIKYLEECGLPVPVSSSCIVCPFHSNELWDELSDDEKEDAYRFDEAIRDILVKRQPEGRKKPFTKQIIHDDQETLFPVDKVVLMNDKPHDPELDKVYLHRSRQPLRDVDFKNEDQAELFDARLEVCDEGCWS